MCFQFSLFQSLAKLLQSLARLRPWLATLWPSLIKFWQGLGEWFQPEYLYDNRTKAWPWLSFVFLGVLIGSGLGAGLNRIGKLDNPGPWTLIILIMSAPVAWYVWLIRDRNHDRQLTTSREELNWEVSKQIHEWAADSTKMEALRALAVIRIREPMMAGARPGETWEEIDRRNPLFKPNQFLLKALLHDRKREFTSVPVSVFDLPPLEQAMVTVLYELSGRRADLAGWNLSGLFLEEFNFRQATLIKTQFRLANLTRADLTGANLSDADLTDADLTRANLPDANLTRVNLTRAKLTRVNLTRAKLTRVNLTRAKLTRAGLTGADLSGANLNGADLIVADLSGANLFVANLSGADLSGANLNGANLLRAKLLGATLIDADLIRANFNGADLLGADLTGAKLIDIDLNEPTLSPPMSRLQNFKNANVSGAKIHKRWRHLIEGVATGEPEWISDEEH